ncbi:MAG: N-acetylmuramoyl-L-alanine amidase [Oscillospiraceae bacterium]
MNKKNIKKGLFVLITVLCLAFYLINITAGTRVKTINSMQTIDSDKKFNVIIDAGHGGADGGAVAADGTNEKDVNLKIAFKVYNILNAFGVNTIMTRTDDNSIHSEDAKTIRDKKVSDIHNRMNVMNNTSNPIFVSIHQNFFADRSLFGTQVFYSPNTTESAELAEFIQSAVINTLQPENKRTIKKSGNSIYLLFYAKKPAVLVECGFFSNVNETEKLKNDNYQNQMAFSIACGILDYIK